MDFLDEGITKSDARRAAGSAFLQFRLLYDFIKGGESKTGVDVIEKENEELYSEKEISQYLYENVKVAVDDFRKLNSRKHVKLMEDELVRMTERSRQTTSDLDEELSERLKLN